MKKATPAYLVGNYLVQDPALLGSYAAKATPIVQRHGGKIIAFNQNVSASEGTAQPTFILIEFPSLADAQGFYDDPEYAPVKPLRLKATTNGVLFITEGVPA